uniref:CPW-WPC domain-containing protein n=1 Tax=viral metagenome TaxID=1070528 RepID=A0A6C0B7L2_9ZZZZ
MFDIDSFYLIVMSVALFVLIVALGFMGWMMSHQKDQVNFPNITTTCPDFWRVADNGNCEQPTTGNFNSGTAITSDTPGFVASTPVSGVTPPNKFNSNHAGWGSGNAAVCKKKKWADTNGIKWDTVTNVNYC